MTTTPKPQSDAEMPVAAMAGPHGVCGGVRFISNPTFQPLTPVDLVRQSDAQAAIAARDAEIERLGLDLKALADRMEYRGNSVSFIYQKADAYRAAIDRVFQVLSAAGVKADGTTHVADLVERAINKPADSSGLTACATGVRTINDWVAEKIPSGPAMHTPSGAVFDTVLAASDPDSLIALTPAGVHAEPARVLPAYGSFSWDWLKWAVGEARGFPVDWSDACHIGHHPVAMNMNSLNRIVSAAVAAKSAQPAADAKCGYCAGKGWTDEGDYEGSRLMTCHACGGSATKPPCAGVGDAVDVVDSGDQSVREARLCVSWSKDHGHKYFVKLPMAQPADTEAQIAEAGLTT